MDELRTERLVGSRPLLRDADELHRICADERVARWVWGDPLTLARTRAMLVREADHWKRNRFGRWVWRQHRKVVGLAGLLRLDDDEVELAWFVDADRWGQGLASEMARAAAEFGFARGLGELTAKTLPDNVASRRVMERIGMEYVGDVMHAGVPHVRYRLSAFGSGAPAGPG